MHGRAGHLLFASLLLFSNTQSVRAACIDAAQLAHSTVSIMRYFDDAERNERPSLVGVRGTGWFLSPTTIVTAEHVTAGMKLSTEAWKPLEIMDGDRSQFISARIQRLAGAQAERLAVIELERAASDARSIAIRKEPLSPEEELITLAYPAGHLQLVGGRFVRFGDDGKLTGMALLEFFEGDNRLIIDHGASGAPVIDCNGQVAAVVSNVFTQSLSLGYRVMRISTAWGTPNVVSVPIQALDDLPQAD
ncbi:S1 family peptidase [Bradyrhizobium sp.]|uniref:S1 family peptidase n=1 Tax=Bradyrhizobium sp. TaxID=376 RepID=UPI001EB1221A|nr:serine protease [Bradyrhizobium sp.]MBV8916946.1 trypsin-like peptidase domain-containing protein [Bradyrhizobium sp.]MBV9984589.1 trypsin-like peptidase domain-containing protein [Bradyrhizobium sp.]